MTPSASLPHSSHGEAGTGLLYGLCAYLVWGFFPVYFKAFGTIPSLQIVSHRILWSVIFLMLLSFRPGRWDDIRRAVTDRRSLLTLLASSILIATNWLVFIIVVGHGQVLQSSLGYFVTPFVSVLLGMIFLKEQLRPLQLISLLMAAAGVITLAIGYGSIPWSALILALTFGSYGLLRKVVRTDALAGLTVETCILVPIAGAYLLVIGVRGEGAFLSRGVGTDLLLMSAGVVTAVPLLLFAAAARRLKLATIGFLQYITPTLHFLLAVAVYGEPFSTTHLTSFLCIWGGLVCYSWDAWRAVDAQRTQTGSGTQP
ncbi:MAG: EamA family transporter RarD [Desulfuromonadales bacterium]|nr:EamA family transporter RarD [Desulfuromonadales bacterium]